jgi:hypothetical protein
LSMWAFGETRPYSRLENGARSQIERMESELLNGS